MDIGSDKPRAYCLNRAFVFSLFVLLSIAATPLGALGANRSAQEDSVGTTQTGQSKVHGYINKDGCRVTETTNLRFIPVNLGFSNMMIRETTTSQSEDCRLSIEATDRALKKGYLAKWDDTVSVEATGYDEDFKKDSKHWGFTSRGTGDLDEHSAYYHLTVPACCGPSATNVFYNVDTGTIAYMSTVPLVHVLVDQGGGEADEFIVAFVDNNATLKDRFKQVAGADDAVAVLDMGPESGAEDRVVVHRTSGDVCVAGADTPIILVDGKPTDSFVDKSKFESPEPHLGVSGVFLEAKLNCDNVGEATLEIPVVRGHLSAEGAKSSDPKITFTSAKKLKNN